MARFVRSVMSPLLGDRAAALKGPVVIAMSAALLFGACRSDGSRNVDRERQIVAAAAAATAAAPGATGAQIVAAVQLQAGSPVEPALAQSLQTVSAGLSPQFAAADVAAESKPANVVFPQTASASMHLEEKTTGAGVDVSLPAAQPVSAQAVGGYVVYPAALGVGASVLHRALPSGTEDFVYMSTRPARAEVDYRVSIGTGIAGLRVVGGVLEFLDPTGTPQLHVSPPVIVGADGTPTDGALAVSGCAFDADPSPPWGRAVTSPGATACTVAVTWPDASVSYPAILDPRWTTTGSMATARIEHTLILLSTGKALAVGGRSSTSSTTGLASAELYDRTSGTWSATGSLAHGRRLHSATQLGTSSNGTTSGKVLVAGGISGTSSMNTAELYSTSAGTWAAAGTMDVVRHGHTATLLADGRVLAAGGLNGTTSLTSASLYNPASGAGTWVATTGPIPPPGVKNHTATLIQTTNNQLNNHVLLVGGNNGTTTISAVYLFDPVQNAFSTLASISTPREQHTAMTLQNTNGKILFAGGKNGSTVLSSAIIFDPSVSNGTWSSAGTMTTPRVGHTMTLLPNTIVANGQVLVAGGTSNGTTVLSSAELFSGTSTWTATPSMPGPLQGQQAVLLSGNMILAAGGLSSSTTVQNAAYLYDASFGLACTSNSQCASGFCANGVCCDTACNGGTCAACNLAGHLGTCTAQPSGTVCRAGTGACDAAETCDGTSFACPADAVQPLGSVCRGAAGDCDVPETCDGTTKNCPADQFAPATTTCRPATSVCDAPETCTGTSTACPADGFAAAGTVCRPIAGGCDVAETCTGTSSVCPADAVAAGGTVCRPAQSICDLAETCTGTSTACPADAFAPAGQTCGAASGSSPAPVCSGTTGTCPETGTTSDILGFEEKNDWAFDPSANASVIGLSSNRTQGASSFEIAVQNTARLTSAPMTSMGGVNPIVLLDIQLPTDQPDQSFWGDVQMFVNSPSLGINYVALGDEVLTGLPVGTWQTLAFQMPAATAAAIVGGMYSDLTFSLVIDAPSGQTGHYFLDNVRFAADVVPSVVGTVQEGSTTKAIFDYVTTSATPVTIPYGLGNGLSNQTGFLTSPAQTPPTTFVSMTHSPFVAVMTGPILSWTIGSHIVTATSNSTHLTPTAAGDGTYDVTLSDGRKVNIDAIAPASPPLSAEPTVGGQYFGTLKGSLSVSPSGAATYTVPIAIPPGVAGMAPSLNLTYNSQGKDGIAGQGWDLTGTSMIHRCPLTRVQDGVAQPIKPLDDDGDSDGLCLDGKRLFKVSQGAYKLESEDFSTILRFTNSTGWSFKIVTKSGQSRYYGLGTGTRVALPDVGNVTRVSVWLLERVVDQWGNYYDLHYDNDDPTRFPFDGAYLTSINYTGHLTGVPDDPNFQSYPGTAVPPPNVITFGYEYRPDPRLVRFHYGTLQITRRLTGITTPQGTYTLAYYPDDPLLPSRLNTIGYCNGPTSLSTAPSTACLDSLQFGWEAGNYGWPQQPDPTDPSSGGQEKSYALPVPLNMHNANGFPVANGVQFADLDGDGRVDLLVQRPSNSSASYAEAHHVWWNNGKGWTPKDEWNPPGVNLIDGSGKASSFLVDADDDGISDIMTTDSQGRPMILYNRIKAGGLWTADIGPLSTTYPQSWGALHFHVDDTTASPIDSILDIDGDGRADIVRQWPYNGEIDVLLNTPSGWTPTGYSVPGDDAGIPADYWHFSDVNRDGLPDLVSGAGAIGASATLINIGLNAVNAITHTHWQLENTNVTLPSYDAAEQHVADVDGDGYYDVIEDNRATVPDQDVGPSIGPAVVFGTGTDYTPYTMYPFGSSPGFYGAYASSLGGYAPPSGSNFFTAADVNGDGLVDAIVIMDEELQNPPRKVLVNGGPGNGWIDAGLSIPYVPYPSSPPSGDAWVDLDGDGLMDIVHSSDDNLGNPAITQAWLNTFHRPMINRFPAGLAAPTAVVYKTITTSDAQQSGTYDDSASLAPNTTYMATPLRVVSSTTADAGLRSDGGGATVVTSYRYEALRGSAFGRGSQGFKSVTVTDPSGMVTTTTYAQAYPYTGMPVSVTRAYNGGDGAPLTCQSDQDCPANNACQDNLCEPTPVEYSHTTTGYCAYQLGADTSGGSNPPCIPMAGAEVAPGTSLFLYPSTVEDVTTLETGTSADRTPGNPTTDVLTTNVFDHHGNPTTVTVVTTVHGSTANCPPTMTNCSPGDESYTSTTVNYYGSEGSDTQLEGKVKRSTVTTQQTVPVVQQARVHTTTFDYDGTSSLCFVNGGQLSCSHSMLGLSAKQVEPGAGYPIELDTTYAYDPFGNVTSTKVCDSGAGGCRTTTASYDPADFVAPHGTGLVTSLQGRYQPGLFPVQQTNAVGHTEYFVYDPVVGRVVQHTGPNGITDCAGYDSFGNQITETARCGSTSPIVTSTSIYRATGAFAPMPSAATVTVVRPTTGAATWTYSDVFGRTIEALARNLNGTLTHTETVYDPLGRLYSRTQPALPGAVSYQTTFLYDGLNRVKQTDTSLADIDGSGTNTVAITFTSYRGSSVTTNETIHGQSQQRTETKNALGKLAWAIDALGGTVQYQYDGDGNLTDVLDPSGNDVHTHYDSRGRKDSMTDPDMGTWQYCYDGFGDLVGQIDAKNSGSTCITGPLTFAMTYDSLGRMISKTAVATGDTAQWMYDSLPGSASGAGIGKLVGMVSEPNGQLNGTCAIPLGFTVTGGDRAVKTYHFDQFGQVQEVDECADGSTFATSYQYDSAGRQTLIRYPAVMGNQLLVGYHYTNTGALQYLTDESTDYAVLWQAKAVDGLGQVADEQMRNGVETVAVRNGATGWMMSSVSTAHADGNTVIQQWSNTFDEAGNLRTRVRTDSVNDFPSTETFEYDGINRLTSSRVQLPTLTPTAYDHIDNFGYDALGNLTSRNNAINSYGTGCVGPAGPHAICTVAGGPGYGYDSNGNMTAGGGRSITYNAANKPTEIVDDSPSQAGTVDFAYGADGNRVLQVVSDSQGTSRTVYVGLGETGKSLYERTTVGGVFTHTFFVYAGGVHNGNGFAVRVMDDNGNVAANKYFNFDHLGSTTAVSDDRGHVASAAVAGPSAGVLGYDPWGARRNPDGQPAAPSTFTLQTGHREFTGHETIPTIGLVNMNGRIYDPIVGRFLSADPNIQSPNDLQSYNRYSYAFNNPLRYTDPTGYFSIGGALPGILIGLVSVGACVAAPGVGCAVAAVVTTLANAEVARGEGASWGQVALTAGIGIAAGTIGGAAGGVLGGALGAKAGSFADFAANLVGGAIGGALGGALSSAAAGGAGLGANVLEGAAQGAVWAAVGWGLKQPTPLTKADSGQGTGASGEQKLEQANRFNQEKSSIQEALDLANTMDGSADPGSAGVLRQLAAESAASALGLDLPEGWTLRYDPSINGNLAGQAFSPGESADEGPGVALGDKAFKDASVLGSRLIHEFVHVEQIVNGDYSSVGLAMLDNAGSLQVLRNEIPAYQAEVNAASVTGVGREEVQMLQAKVAWATNNYLYGGDYPVSMARQF